MENQEIITNLITLVATSLGAAIVRFFEKRKMERKRKEEEGAKDNG